MAVSLPSDLVADVLRNADPSLRSAAVTRLQSFGADGREFSAAVMNAGERATAHGPRDLAGAGPEISSPTERGVRAPYQGFERMVLRNLFENLLPDEGSGAFGAGPSAGIWRSMAADQLAGAYAESGGIGIAHMLSAAEGEAAPRRISEWPYFSLNSLRVPGGAG